MLYEGLSSLCFSCGRVGHKAEACSYHARAPEQGGIGTRRDNQVIKTDQKENNEQAFGPWVLVSQKKQGGKKPKKAPTYVSTSVLNTHKPKSWVSNEVVDQMSFGEVSFDLGKS